MIVIEGSLGQSQCRMKSGGGGPCAELEMVQGRNKDGGGGIADSYIGGVSLLCLLCDLQVSIWDL